MSELTNEEKYRLMWTELVLTGDGDKSETVAYKISPKKPIHACFACVEARVRGGLDPHYMPDSFGVRVIVEKVCIHCPIVWGTEHMKSDFITPCSRTGSPYEAWLKRSRFSDAKKQYAKQIATLPWTEREKKCEAIWSWADRDNAPRGCKKFLQLKRMEDNIYLQVVDENGREYSQGHLGVFKTTGGGLRLYGHVDTTLGFRLDRDDRLVVTND